MRLMLEKTSTSLQVRDDADVERRRRGLERFTPWIVATVRSVATLLLLTAAASAVNTDLVDNTLYGGAYDTSSAIAYAEFFDGAHYTYPQVVQTCFGGLEVGTCEAFSPNWLKDFLDQYNADSTGAYCAGCCSNSDTSGNAWTFDCALISSSFVDFVNLFGWEFRFARRETFEDTGVVTCPIRRDGCSYDGDGVLTGTCDGDGSYLGAYVLTLEVMTVEKGLKTWKSVQSCSVEVEESIDEPSSLSETIIMNQVYSRDRSAIEPGWAVLISAAAFFVLSCAVRFFRDDRCVVCAHHLIWFREVCFACRLYGYDPPSEDVKEIIRDKRLVVLPDLTLSERVGTVKAITSKVFGKVTGGLMMTRTLVRTKGRLADTQVSPHEGNGDDATRVAPLGFSQTRGEDEGAAGGRPTVDRPVGARANLKFPSRISSARSVTFTDGILDGSPRTGDTALRTGKLVTMESDGEDMQETARAPKKRKICSLTGDGAISLQWV